MSAMRQAGPALATLLACVAAACSPAPTPTPEATTQPAPAATPAAETARAAAVDGPPVDQAALELDFTGEALAWMRAHARPAPAALAEAARAKATAEATEDDCAHLVDGDRAFAADLDGDGVLEGITAATLESCGGGGNNYLRALVVWREDAAGWQPVLTTAIGTNPGGNRSVATIADGALTLVGDQGAYGSTQPPETLQVPGARP